ncbi:MAG: hypothetical protein WC400_02360 [Patescibacteria group bacterium]|jgi:hypothetical protein
MLTAENGKKLGFFLSVNGVTPSIDQPPGGRGNTLELETAYVSISIGDRESAQRPGERETWYNFESRRAAEIAFLSMIDGVLCVVVMRKQYTKDDSWMYKIPGGYDFSDENPNFHLIDKIALDTGLRLVNQPIYLGSTAGHPEIDTPIGLFCALPGSWEPQDRPRKGIELLERPLEWALDYFDQHALGDEHQLADIFGECIDASGVNHDSPLYHVNSTGFELLFRLDRRLRKGVITIPGYTHG